MASVAASDIQENFGEWHDRAMEAPVAISRQGRTTAYLVSSHFFEDLVASYRRSMRVEDLGAAEIELMARTQIVEGEAYDLSDVPECDHDVAPAQTR